MKNYFNNLFFRVITIIFCIVIITNLSAQTTTSSPACTTNATEWIIESITVSDDYTIVKYKFYTTRSDYKFYIHPSMYIQKYNNTNATNYYIKEFTSNKLNTSYTATAKTTYYFELKFEAIPKGLTNISIIEPSSEGATAWYWKNITIKNPETTATTTVKNYEVKKYTNNSNVYNLHTFTMGDDVKVKYFAQNAYSRYSTWKKDKNVLLVCSGAFSETWDVNSVPVGFTIDNGTVVNKSIDNVMDGFVIVFEELIVALDLDYLESGIELEDGSTLSLNPRTSESDKAIIKDMAVENSYTIFQTQMVYSQNKTTNFINLLYGKQRERRYLALCTKGDNYYNIMVDAPGYLYLNESSKSAKDVLEYAGYTVNYILNLDTGDKNICYVNQGGSLVSIGDDDISKATNLIIFYK